MERLNQVAHGQRQEKYAARMRQELADIDHDIEVAEQRAVEAEEVLAEVETFISEKLSVATAVNRDDPDQYTAGVIDILTELEELLKESIQIAYKDDDD